MGALLLDEDSLVDAEIVVDHRNQSVTVTDGLQKLDQFRFTAESYKGTCAKKRKMDMATRKTESTPIQNIHAPKSQIPSESEIVVDESSPCKRPSSPSSVCSPTQKMKYALTPPSSNPPGMKSGASLSPITPVREVKQLDLRAFFSNKK
ncbi:phosphoglycerate mutase [Perkinsela sp. CCAP 1560/4]|nr:phosphoglycerate mutase [Perkinsela sp. CCAP 1560/4]|eukprot:KNH08034.1 phosphoglycerate mutase [Perkinsela sp. CCAP 1560/4]